LQAAAPFTMPEGSPEPARPATETAVPGAGPRHPAQRASHATGGDDGGRPGEGAGREGGAQGEGCSAVEAGGAGVHGDDEV